MNDGSSQSNLQIRVVWFHWLHVDQAKALPSVSNSEIDNEKENRWEIPSKARPTLVIDEEHGGDGIKRYLVHKLTTQVTSMTGNQRKKFVYIGRCVNKKKESYACLLRCEYPENLRKDQGQKILSRQDSDHIIRELAAHSRGYRGSPE